MTKPNIKQTKVDVPAPPKPRTNRAHFAHSAPTIAVTPDNLSRPSGSDELVFLNFKVAPDFHRRFKIQATQRGMSMKELLEAAFKEYTRNFPMKQPDIFRDQD